MIEKAGEGLSSEAEPREYCSWRRIHLADAPTKRVMVRAVKTGKAPLELLPPLILHDRTGGKHTSEAEGILRGEAALGWA